jgi:hypothetical protein
MPRDQIVNFDSKVFIYVAWAGIGLLAIATVYSVVIGDWLGLLFLAGFLAASIGFVAYENRLPALFDVLFVSSALVNAVGWAWKYYDAIRGYDEVVHFYTTFTFTLSLGYLAFFAVRIHFQHHLWHFVLVIASFGISAGVFWEFFEWMVLPKPDNVLEDLAMDSLGAVLAGCLAAWVLGAESGQETAEPESKPA